MIDDELKQQIENAAENYATKMVWINQEQADSQLFYEYISKTSFEVGATYATKLQTADKVNSELEETNRGLVEQLNQQKQMTQKWRDESIGQAKVINELKNLLNEVFQKHGSIILVHDSAIYQKIKKFLYGE